MGYVIGIDGGGTKTHGALFDTKGNRLDLIEWGPTNHESMPGSFADLKKELDKLLKLLFSRNNIGIAQTEKFVFGMAGVDTRLQYRTISSMIGSLGIDKFILCNDSFLGIKAGCVSGYGICAINGTGCTVSGIDAKGNMLQIGGQGALTGDKGGGGYIAYAAIERVYGSIYKNSRSTIMKDMIFAELGIAGEEDFLETVTEKLINDRAVMKTICRIAFNAANKGDTAALSLFEEIGINYFNCICGLLNKLDFSSANPLEIVLTGSIFTKGENSKIIDTINERVSAAFPGMDAEFKVLSVPPVAGAVIWGLESIHGNNDLYGKVIKSFL